MMACQQKTPLFCTKLPSNGNWSTTKKQLSQTRSVKEFAPFAYSGVVPEPLAHTRALAIALQSLFYAVADLEWAHFKSATV